MEATWWFENEVAPREASRPVPCCALVDAPQAAQPTPPGRSAARWPSLLAFQGPKIE
jgi:hypothetical protein